jgi:hypothetical protein
VADVTVETSIMPNNSARNGKTYIAHLRPNMISIMRGDMQYQEEVTFKNGVGYEPPMTYSFCTKSMNRFWRRDGKQ